MTDSKWFSSQVIHGSRIGRLLGFPTINLEIPGDLEQYRQGVYAAKLKINNKNYIGALYFGPRKMLGETKIRLEVFVLDFDKQIYGEIISFQIFNFIRPPKEFADYTDYKNQLDSDIGNIKKSLPSKTS